VLCAACVRALRPVGRPWCDLCGAPTLWPVARCRECTGRRLGFASARAAVTYVGPARPLVAAWKEHGLRRVASLAASLVADTVPRPAADVITYIPPDPHRLLRRGHHPAERLARELGSRWQLDVAPLLVRSAGMRARPRQADLDRLDRARNVRDAYVAVARLPGNIVLVDDVYTTGATTAAGATALRRAGAARVDVVTFARTARV
jgi:predicted amidophosphoribosyltransferase